MTLDLATGTIALGDPDAVTLEEHPGDGHVAPALRSRTILHSVAAFVGRHSGFILHVRLCVPASATDEQVERWLACIDAALADEASIAGRIARTFERGERYARVHVELGVRVPGVVQPPLA